jgi:hypothetical protein
LASRARAQRRPAVHPLDRPRHRLERAFELGGVDQIQLRDGQIKEQRIYEPSRFDPRPKEGEPMSKVMSKDGTLITFDLVEQGMEPAIRLLLGTAVQHALQGTGWVQAIGLRGGPSPHAGTHRSSPCTACVDEVGALPSGRVVLSRAVWRYYDPLRLPLGRPPLPGGCRL